MTDFSRPVASTDVLHRSQHPVEPSRGLLDVGTDRLAARPDQAADLRAAVARFNAAPLSLSAVDQLRRDILTVADTLDGGPLDTVMGRAREAWERRYGGDAA